MARAQGVGLVELADEMECELDIEPAATLSPRHAPTWRRPMGGAHADEQAGSPGGGMRVAAAIRQTVSPSGAGALPCDIVRVAAATASTLPTNGGGGLAAPAVQLDFD